MFGFVAFIEQNENDTNDNLCKFNVGIYEGCPKSS